MPYAIKGLLRLGATGLHALSARASLLTLGETWARRAIFRPLVRDKLPEAVALCPAIFLKTKGDCGRG
jgi:hypothetical protein